MQEEITRERSIPNTILLVFTELCQKPSRISKCHQSEVSVLVEDIYEHRLHWYWSHAYETSEKLGF